MALVFHRRLALPLWAMVSLTVALTTSPLATLSLTAVLWIRVTAFTMAGLVARLCTSRSLLRVVSHGQRTVPR